MAELYPDLGTVSRSGPNTRTPVDIIGGKRYGLTLCRNVANDKGVLVISMKLRFDYKDGEILLPGNKSRKLTWTQPEKDRWASDYTTAVKEVWDDRFRIKGFTNRPDVIPRQLRDVGVQFEFRSLIGGWNPNDDYDLSVIKIDGDQEHRSGVNTSSNKVDLDSADLTPIFTIALANQRTAVHEFGHMLGLRDEYGDFLGDTGNRNFNWQSDLQSVMSAGETVRPRHYVPFAQWLTEKYQTVADLLHCKIEYKVEDATGKLWDASNARL